MSMKINPPHLVGKSYERYRVELEAWREDTELDKNKQGIAIALTFPENDENHIREKVFDEIPVADLKRDGLDILISFLDKKLLKDDLVDSWEKFNDFEDLKNVIQ